MTPLFGTNLTDAMMVNPWMFDPTQQSNQFSNYNNAPIPFPPSYNGVPTNAMGQPIQSFLDWQKANPGGMSINSTPSQPAPQQQPQVYDTNGVPLTGQAAAWAAFDPSANVSFGGNLSGLSGAATHGMTGTTGSAPTTAPAAPQPSGPPNNWQAAINALSNPGNPVTPGATVPMSTGSQPAGGVNAAWLQGIGGGQGMNQNFVNALRNIQGR